VTAASVPALPLRDAINGVGVERAPESLLLLGDTLLKELLIDLLPIVRWAWKSIVFVSVHVNYLLKQTLLPWTLRTALLQNTWTFGKVSLLARLESSLGPLLLFLYGLVGGVDIETALFFHFRIISALTCPVVAVFQGDRAF